MSVNPQLTLIWWKVRATQGKGLMPDNTSRFSIDGKPIHHFVSWVRFSRVNSTNSFADGNFDFLPVHGSR